MTREVAMPHAAPNKPEARMDPVIHAPGVAAPIDVDLTVCCATSDEALSKGAASRDGVATELAAYKKRRKYRNISLVAFALEDHGRIGDEALRLARRLAPRALDERSAALRSLYQALSCTLQRLQADSAIAAFGA